jgi:hypothetical protein
MVNENDMGSYVFVSFCVCSFRWLQILFFFFCIIFCLSAYWGFCFQLFVDGLIVLLLDGDTALVAYNFLFCRGPHCFVVHDIFLLDRFVI